MKTFFLCTLLFVSFLVQAQEQVSDVYFDELLYPIQVGKACSFHSYDEVDYMIIDNDSIQIFELVDEKFELKHVVHKIGDFACKRLGKDLNNSPIKRIEDKYYFGFYQYGILIVDLENGSIIRSKDISEFDYKLNDVTKVIDNQIYFYGSHGGSDFGFFRYDIESDEIYFLEAFRNSIDNIQLIEHTYYFNDISLSQIGGYDMLKDSLFVKYEYESELVSDLFYGTNLGEEYIVFRDEESFKIIQENGEIVAFSCDEELPESTILAVRGSKIIVASKRDNKDQVQVYQKDNCELVHDFFIDDENYSTTNSFYINDNQLEDYTIIGYLGNNYSIGVGLVIDHTTNSESSPFEYNYYQLGATATQTDNAMYWEGFDYIMRYDIATQMVSSISPHINFSSNPVEIEKILSSSIGIAKGNLIYFISNNNSNDFNIWRTSDGFNFSVAMPLDFSYNKGVYTRTGIRVDDESVVSSGLGGLMITEGSTDVIWSDNYFRGLAIRENYIATTTSVRPLNVTTVTGVGENYVLKYNKQTETQSKHYLNNDFHLQFKPIITDRFIFNTDVGTDNYFDIENEEFKHLNTNSPSLNIVPRTFYRGTNKMLVGEKPWSEYYLFDFDTEELERIDHDLPRATNCYITDNDIFYLYVKNFNNANEEVSRFIDGEIPEIIYSGDCCKLTMGGISNAKTGVYTELFFRYDGGFLILTDDGSSTQVTEFADEAIHPNANINVLYSKKDEYLIERTINGQDVITLFNSPGTYKDIDIPNLEKVITTSFSLVKPLIITLNEDEKTYQFYTLDKETGELELRMQSTNEHKIYAPGVYYNPPQAISNSQYVFTALHADKGDELFELDLVNQIFELKVDLYEGKLSSTPEYYTRTTDYLYFIARLKSDEKQWFRIGTDLLTSNNDIVIEPLVDLAIFPNPSSLSINTKSVLERYSIYNTQGQEVLSNFNNSSKDIDISQLTVGHYIISGIDKNEVLFSGKFVKTD